MSRNLLVRIVLGGSLGFFGAAATIQAVEWFNVNNVPDQVLGAPDIDDYCKIEAPTLRSMNVSGDAAGWRCVGFIRSVWSTESVDLGEACRAEFGEQARVSVVDEWSPDGILCVQRT